MATGALIPLLMCACSSKIPPHLQPDRPSQDAAEHASIIDLSSALVHLTEKDPLVRAPALPNVEALEGFPEGEPLLAYVNRVRFLERGDGQVERELQQLEDEFQGTAVVALARGYRLRVVENVLATTPEVDEATEAQVAVLITPLQNATSEATLPRPPLAWLGAEGRLPDRVRQVADRWALSAWLDHPSIPLEPVGQALAAPMYDGLSETPIGALIRARAEGADGDPTAGLEDLTQATTLALTRAAADRDREQAEWSALKRATAEELGVDSPIDHLLEQAADSLTLAAASDRAAGGALLAHAARRWRNGCGDPPCGGVDRVEWMGRAARWDPEVERLAALWQVIALKEAVDSMDVGHDTVIFPRAVLDLTDALLGTGAGPLDLSLLRKQSPDAQAWLEISRAVGTEGVTDWSETRAALGQHLRDQAQRASTLVDDPALEDLLGRISSRAVP